MNKIVSIGLTEFLEDNVKEITSTMKWMEGKEMRLIKSIEELKDFVDKAINIKLCAVDTETTGLNTRTRNGSPTDKLVGISMSYDTNIGVYVPINHQAGPEYNLPEKEVIEEIKRLCASCTTIYHNSKFDLQFFKNYGIIITDHNLFEDTQILARLYDSGQKEIGLKHLSNLLLNQHMIEYTDIAKDAKRFDFVPPNVGYLYAASDAICTLGLFQFFMSQNIIKGQMAVYRLEKRLVPVVMEMEANLVMVDVPYLLKLKADVEKRIKEIEKTIHKLAGKEFNVASSQQLGKLLFDELKYEYPSKERTASGQYSTDSATLGKIADQYPIVGSIIEFRELEKSLGTYIKNLITNHDENNLIKFSFNQSGTDTGRFSSPGGRGIDEDGYCGVNAQNIPSNYDPSVPDIRKAIIARPGRKLVSVDYSGEELRVAANLSRESKWIDEFLNGDGDLHKKTGQVLFGRMDITKAERGIAKTFNFQILYGAGARGLAQQAKISENEAKRLLANFFSGLPQLKKWIDTEVKRSKKSKEVKTAFGRIRPLAKYFETEDFAMIAHGERCVANSLIQGACADIMKTAMVRIYNWIHNNNLQDDIKLLLTIHDELIFEMPESKMSEFIPKIMDIMRLDDILQGLLKWPVPLAQDCEYGDSLHVDHNYLEEHPEVMKKEAHVAFHTSTQVTASVEEPVKVPEPVAPPLIQEVAQDDQKPIQSVGVIEELLKDTTASVSPQSDSTGPFLPNSQLPNLERAIDLLKSSIENDLSDKNLTNSDNFVYTVKDRSKSTQRKLNQILLFLIDEEKKEGYQGPKKLITIKDPEGNSLLVSDFKFSVDSFLALARFYGV